MSISSEKKKNEFKVLLPLEFHSGTNALWRKKGISQKMSAIYRLSKKVFILVFVSQTTPV